MRVKCLAQEHNIMTRPGLEPGPLDPEFSALFLQDRDNSHSSYTTLTTAYDGCIIMHFVVCSSCHPLAKLFSHFIQTK